MIYLDNAATTFQKPESVKKAVIYALNNLASPGRGVYPPSLKASKIVFSAREALSELFNIKTPENIIFTSNATFALNTALKGFLSPGDSFAISSMEHNAVARPAESLRKKGGDYAISIGGQLGAAPWVVTQNQAMLEKFYNEVIETYSLKRMDLDIEESNQDYSQNIINAKAIKSVQDKTNIEITLTIPIMPSGWEQKQINIIKACSKKTYKL